MKINGNLILGEGGSIVNLTLPSGNAFPGNANHAEMFVLNVQITGFAPGLYNYDGTAKKWLLVADYAAVIGVLKQHTDNKDIHVGNWTQNCKRIKDGERLTVKEDFQFLIHGAFRVEGVLDVQGEVLIR